MQKPDFPIIMFLAALFGDVVLGIIVFFATILLLPIGWFLGVMVNFIYAGIFWVWFMLKSVSVQKRLMNKFMLRLAIGIMISFIPLLRLFIPMKTLVVYLTYKGEKEEWKKYQKQQRRALATTPPPVRRRVRRATA